MCVNSIGAVSYVCSSSGGLSSSSSRDIQFNASHNPRATQPGAARIGAIAAEGAAADTLQSDETRAADDRNEAGLLRHERRVAHVAPTE